MLCGSCAGQAIEDEVDGVYLETCEECGKEYDFITENSEFDNNFYESNGTSLRDCWDDKILCSDCVLRRVKNERIHILKKIT